MLRPTVPARFGALLTEIRTAIASVEGFLTPREADFLALLGACPTAEGCILEIGSHKGRSTVTLALASALADRTTVVACDPLTSPSTTDPNLAGAPSCLETFRANVERAGVAARVNLRQMLSSELAKTWSGPIRLLWIDGDHTYRGAKLDFDLFSPFLAEGAIVAFHDCLHPYFEGPLRVLSENVVLSPRFGPVGMVGNVGWGRYLGERSELDQIAQFDERMHFYGRLQALLPHQIDRRPTGFLRRKLFLLRRVLIPHGPVDPARWAASLA